MNAFIIGNGFDLAHEMDTKCCHFRKFLKKKYPNIKPEIMFVPTQTIAPDGGVVINETDAVSLLFF